MKYATEKDCLSFGHYLTEKEVKKEWELFKKTAIFEESEFILFDFGSYLINNPIKVQYELMKWTEQIEDYNQIFKYV